MRTSISSRRQRSPTSSGDDQRQPGSRSQSRGPPHQRQRQTSIDRSIREKRRRTVFDNPVDSRTKGHPRRDSRDVDHRSRNTQRNTQRAGFDIKKESDHLHQRRSRSPEMQARGYQREARGPRNGHHESAQDRRTSTQRPMQEPERERSLSPFSKRLAMTKAMHGR
ncbi:hypothetical protein CP533_0513 [Ophiocordyceps camponoti-saundersi (nom. inval.)]|nr:hypothetical protein CP533_0513 [Ophiocordyceps camponoti-saundersi (nom. inval.)]